MSDSEVSETKRLTIQTAEKILGEPFPVLNHGFVRLVDYMGGDDRIVQAARVSYGKGTKKVREDQGLIHYLMRHRHTSPFEQVELTFHAKMPIFVARQWVRHRTASLNEISARYSVLDREFYVPTDDAIQFQSASNRQGRDVREVPADLRARVLDILKRGQEASYREYEEMLDFQPDGSEGEKSIARELARIHLPLSIYTQWYWKVNLHNLFHFLALRLDTHAQMEIRVYAEAMAKMARAVAPAAYEAFEEHMQFGMRLSRSEVNALREIIVGRPNPITAKRALAEFTEKISRFMPAKSETTTSE